MNVKETEEKINSIAVKEIKEKTDFVFDSLVNKQVRGKLPENIFKNYFFKYFSGEVLITPDSKVIQEWISVAGSPMSEVDIIDAAGNTLYTVPSLFDTDILEIAKRKAGEAFPDIYKNYQVRANRLPVIGENFLNGALDDKINNITKMSDNQTPNKVKWQSIFDRYNKPFVGATPGSKTVSEPSVSDDMVYD